MTNWFIQMVKIWLVHNCETEEDNLNMKIVIALLFTYNACTLINMMEICVTNNNKLKSLNFKITLYWGVNFLREIKKFGYFKKLEKFSCCGRGNKKLIDDLSHLQDKFSKIIE